MAVAWGQGVLVVALPAANYTQRVIFEAQVGGGMWVPTGSRAGKSADLRQSLAASCLQRVPVVKSGILEIISYPVCSRHGEEKTKTQNKVRVQPRREGTESGVTCRLFAYESISKQTFYEHEMRNDK